MIVGLHDSDYTGFPNLALMKLSAWHKQHGDHVEMWNALMSYDVVYSSKIFTFSPENPYLPSGTIKGGMGYGMMDELPEEIDAMQPDYSLYPKCNHAIGFLTRGCIRQCPWCIVPKKEGSIRPYRRWEEIKRPDSRDMVLMDNNALACEWGIEQIERMGAADVRVDFNQGLDARLVTREIAGKLANLKWIRYVRFSCDTTQMIDTVLQAVAYCREAGIGKSKFWCYVLVQDVDDAHGRVIALDRAGIECFAQPYRSYDGAEPPQEQRKFARWVNNKAVFSSCLWENYRA